MKVALLTTVPLSLRFLAGQVRFLQQQGVEISVISSPGQALDAFAEETAVEAIGVTMTRRISPLRDLLSLWQLIRELHRIRPDIVHAHTPKAGLLGMLAAAIVRVPIRFYHIHGLPLLTAVGFKRRVLWICDTIACCLAHHVYCVSHSIRQEVAKERICNSKKLTVVANGTIDGIDADGRFNPRRFHGDSLAALRCFLDIPAGAPVIGFVGRIVPDKGIQELLDAFTRLTRDFPDVHLLIVGCMDPEQPISSTACDSLNHDRRIHLVGFADDPAIYYSIMDVLAFPTYREGFGLVAAEAAAMKIPVVTSRIPGCVDAVVDDITGTLIPPRDAGALAEALVAYLHDPQLRRLHGTAGRTRVSQDFQPARVRAAFWRQYLKWMQAKHRPLRAVTPMRQKNAAA